ncbi:winged helix-turn-helix domain-containing protein [Marinibaculum pumilum]|uniref:Winged helix-turn-helix domain-containing protein n=1 Tax=Marinibaculum pumilum TaxID=1766165 RepID=A0ABV7KYJ4_9PROT
MPKPPPAPLPLSATHARRIWLRAQRLDADAPFGAGPQAVRAAVAHLGYVQIDTINVVERSHHHILWSRIPDYRRADLQAAQSGEKSVFEYWTHALSYVPTADFRFFLPAMRQFGRESKSWFGTVRPADMRKVMRLVRDQGPISIRDIDDDTLVEKTHAWGSRKPSKKALQLAFFTGALTIAARDGMLKSYDLTDRHFGWTAKPRAATEGQLLDYLLDRALRSQGVVSLDSICHLDAGRKPAIRQRIESRVRRGKLRPVALEGADKTEHWATPEALDGAAAPLPDLLHILSPFDPLIIQRKRLSLFFGYDHLFEAYVPKAKRRLGYFALPVLDGERIVAALDLKADRQAGSLLIQNWTWTEGRRPAGLKARIEEALHRFEGFQFGE